MRLLFELDAENYGEGLEVHTRPSARAIIIEDGKIAMVHSLKYDYYKFPGGGIEDGESRLDALVRETLEEAGLVVDPDSVREFGAARRREKGKGDFIFEQDNYYYLCDCTSEGEQSLDDYERDERFTLELVSASVAARRNREKSHGPKSKLMTEREARVLDILIKEGYVPE